MKNIVAKEMIVKAIETNDKEMARKIAEELTQGKLEGTEKQIAYAIDLVETKLLSRDRLDIAKAAPVMAKVIEAKLEETKYAGDLIDFCKGYNGPLERAQEEYIEALRVYRKGCGWEMEASKAAEFAAQYLGGK